jgi:hypothetical protein
MEGPSADNSTDRAFTLLSKIEQTTEFVDPHRIVPFSFIRTLHPEGMLCILHGFVKSGWDSNRAGIYVVTLDENPLPLRSSLPDKGSTVPSSEPVSNDAPLYGCIGWHRPAAIKTLLTTEPGGVLNQSWPEENVRFVSADDSSSIFPGWPLDVDNGRVARVPVTILQELVPAHHLISIALHLSNASSHVVVATTYIDTLAAGKRYLEVHCDNLRRRAVHGMHYLGGPPAEKCGPRSNPAKKAFVDQMAGLQGVTRRNAEKDYSAVLFLNRTPLSCSRNLKLRFPSPSSML